MTSKIYKLTNRPKLIDLNGENVNFKLEFIVQALDPQHEFHVIVLTQEQLDSVDLNKIEMKVAKGKISGNITANNNKYQNYFLVLKKLNNTETEIDVEIITNLEKLEDNIVQINENPSQENYSNTAGQSNSSTSDSATTTLECAPYYKKPWFWLFLIILIVCIGFIYYNYFYLKKPFFWQKNTSSSAPIKSVDNIPPPDNPSKELYQQISAMDLN